MAQLLPAEPVAAVLAYHERTKHRLDRYAAGPDHLDWDDQPEPFRRFDGAPTVALPLRADGVGIPFSELAHAPPQPLNLAGIALLLECALGIAAWKVYGESRWALRCNPSSGNLHPTEGYLVAADIAGLADGVYHYAPRDHLLEQRCAFTDQGNASEVLLLGLSSIPWREMWKYGERAFRYVQLDIGHALGAVRYAAALLGWRVEVLAAGDPQIATLLGLDRHDDFAGAEREEPDLLLRLFNPMNPVTETPPARWIERAEQGAWSGRANAIGGRPRPRWPVIGEVIAATRNPEPLAFAGTVAEQHSASSPAAAATLPATKLIRGRRSAQAYDGRTYCTEAHFRRILTAVLPHPAQFPWDIWPQRARLHLLLFVHRVEGVEPGLYLLPRDPGAAPHLRAAMRSEFTWRPVYPDAGLPLHHLLTADAREVARILSCHQRIAADSAFSLGMIAEFEAPVRQNPAEYRRLYWEAGLIGQVLYLEAEAAGLRGTGIGCFFDDAVHDALGLQGQRFQSLYHFTIGGALTDDRIQSLPPYDHLGDRLT